MWHLIKWERVENVKKPSLNKKRRLRFYRGHTRLRSDPMRPFETSRSRSPRLQKRSSLPLPCPVRHGCPVPAHRDRTARSGSPHQRWSSSAAVRRRCSPCRPPARPPSARVLAAAVRSRTPCRRRRCSSPDRPRAR
jgi:hypothetical protein